MVAFPPAKINLGLQVISRRPDGFHDLVTCFYPLPLSDILEIIISESFSFTTSGLKVPGDSNDNLCVRAYELLKNDFGLGPVQMHLHKLIPMGAGLGGGSSDGAWTLRILDRIFQLQLSPDQLSSYASRLGSDCAFFVHDGPAFGRGRGDILERTSVALAGKFMVLVQPPVFIATADAYSAIRPRTPETDLRDVVRNLPLAQWKKKLGNDFEGPVFEKYPQVEAVKRDLYNHGAVYAGMSGSGSAVFGIFHTPVDLRHLFSGMFYWAGSA